MALPANSPQSGEKPRDIKLNNRRIVLELLRRQDKITLGELAASCSLSRNTVKKCMDFFLEKGIAADAGKGCSTSEGGKKPDMFRLDENWGILCSFYVRYGEVRGALYTIGLTRLCADREPLFAYSPGEVVDSCERLLRRLLERCGWDAGRLKAISCALHGVVDTYTGTVLSEFHADKSLSGLEDSAGHWNGHVPLGKMLTERLGAPVTCSNPVRTMLLCEAEKDTAIRDNSALIYTHDAAPMAALIRGGHVIQGKRCVLGEIGGIPLNFTAHPDSGTSLGGDGLGHLVCRRRLLEEMNRHPELLLSSTLYTLGHEPTLSDIFAAAENGDELGRAMVRHAARWFAVSIRQFLFLADPDIILIQGDYAKAGSYFLETLRQYVKSYVAPSVSVIPDIRLSSQEEVDSCILGGAIVASGQVFGSDTMYE